MADPSNEDIEILKIIAYIFADSREILESHKELREVIKDDKIFELYQAYIRDTNERKVQEVLFSRFIDNALEYKQHLHKTEFTDLGHRAALQNLTDQLDVLRARSFRESHLNKYYTRLIDQADKLLLINAYIDVIDKYRILANANGTPVDDLSENEVELDKLTVEQIAIHLVEILHKYIQLAVHRVRIYMESAEFCGQLYPKLKPFLDAISLTALIHGVFSNLVSSALTGVTVLTPESVLLRNLMALWGAAWLGSLYLRRKLDAVCLDSKIANVERNDSIPVKVDDVSPNAGPVYPSPKNSNNHIFHNALESLGFSSRVWQEGRPIVGYMLILIPKNTALPAKGEVTVYTIEDNQEAMNLDIRRGEDKVAVNNPVIKQFSITGLPRDIAGRVAVQVNYELNERGYLSATAKGVHFNREAQVAIGDVLTK